MDSNGKVFTLYHIQVMERVVRHRFRDFVTLQRAIGGRLPDARLPGLPSKTARLEERGRLLQRYLDELLGVPEVGEQEEIEAFFGGGEPRPSGEDPGRAPSQGGEHWLGTDERRLSLLNFRGS